MESPFYVHLLADPLILSYSCKCDGQFQVAQAEQSHDRNDDMHNQGGGTGRSGESAGVHSGTDGGERGTRSDGEGMEDNDSVVDEEVVSPASYVTHLSVTLCMLIGDIVEREEGLQATHLVARCNAQKTLMAHNFSAGSMFFA